MRQKDDNSPINAFITVEKGHLEETIKVFTLSRETTTIGRPAHDYTPDIKLNDPQISRNHAEICLRDGIFWLCDKGSTNGTTLNGKPLEKEKGYPLTDNSTIGIAIVQNAPRAELLFRQTRGDIVEPLEQSSRNYPWLDIDDGRKEVRIDNKLVPLPPKEYNLLLLLYRKAGNVCSRDEIIATVWSDVQDPGAVSDATVDQLVHRLREKVEPVPSNPARIVSKKRFGYLLV
jgi:pSer/pThr/pTyr-binding forkhead associated (FHA) protein